MPDPESHGSNLACRVRVRIIAAPAGHPGWSSRTRPGRTSRRPVEFGSLWPPTDCPPRPTLPRTTDVPRPDPHLVLRETFGFDAFRPGQREVIDAVLEGRDCIAVMPTGAGKSLTYQLPARILDGTVLVVSPLISLMKDQVDALRELGFEAVEINSTLDREERRARLDGLRRGAYELVYLAPEALD
ncbi:MAG: DEAD/DEAH box helicase, partial [Actinobacteria bacterium]|nr:DEAD/DEAH box helicase [Actinomycetota bacterium]NIS29249.1 DEAD/DEAH box helicase [Actinomycetota bacterium]NIT94408.1 DEAD/DEAH box helicase [Actinomycetota bacterium]NIU64642.1 DEAD/DEAH box helicase [Actinomycetota bacterium]NIV85830.1 DEAD/DEAH box helicase [Actinomycetota bacterium]